MLQPHCRRKTRSSISSEPLSGSVPEESLPSAPPRRSRPSGHSAEDEDDEFDYFDSPVRNDVSLHTPRPRIDFPARDGIPHHWEYAAAKGLLPSRTSEARTRDVPCRACDDRVRRRDFFTGPLHYGCVRCIETSATSGKLDSARASAGRSGAGNDLQCDHASCSYHCSLSEDLAEFANESDVISLDRPFSVVAEVEPRPGPPNSDIKRAHAYKGTDLQGIPWYTLPHNRAEVRATRLRTASRSATEPAAADLAAEPRNNVNFYSFFVNNRRVKCSIVHFQLRNLCWAVTTQDVLVMHDHCIVHYNTATARKMVILDLTGSATSDSNFLVQISTMACKGNLLVCGGFLGEVIAKDIDSGKILKNGRVSFEENVITNALDLYDDRLMTSNNDSYIRIFDLNTWQRLSAYRFAAPVNHATRQPGGKMVCAVGDEKLVNMLDGDTGTLIQQLRGHEGCSFATAWHPDGHVFATGSQDSTCRLWDVRNMSQSLRIIGARTQAVRSIRFSPDRRYLGIAEERDFAHVYDVRNGLYDTAQELEMFGELVGLSFTPDAEALFVGLSDRSYSGLLQYHLNSSKFTRGAIP